MTLLRAVFPADISSEGLPDDEVQIRMSTGQRARDGHILDPAGCQLANYRANPVVLWQHDVAEPIASNVQVSQLDDCITARTKFAPPGVSATADKIRGLVKAGIVRGVSIGFDIIDAEPIDAARPRAGLRVSKWELLECSFCSVPVDTGATVTARAESAEDWKVGASRDLPVEDSDDWDGGEAAASIFAHAGGEDFEPAAARKGFLVYDAAHPKLRGSYKLPIAHVVGGEMKVPKGAIRAAASRLPQTDIPDDVRTKAQAVLDHYKEKAGMVDTEGRAARVQRIRALVLTSSAAAPTVRGLYDVASLCYLLDQLGYAKQSASWEAALEDDASQVPAMLGEVLQRLGAVLVAMTEEEVAELVRSVPATMAVEDEQLDTGERAYLRAAATPLARAWRAATIRVRAGKALSAATAKKLDAANGYIDRASDKTDEAASHNDKVRAAHESASDAHVAASKAHDKLGEALAAAKDKPDDAAEHVARAMTHHRALGRNLDAIGDQQNDLGMAHDDAADCTNSAARSMRAATRCLRAVLDGSDAGTEDGDSRLVQTSDGDGDSEGAANGRSLTLDARQRRMRLLELSAAP